MEEDVTQLEMADSDEMTNDDEAVAARKKDDEENGIIAILIG